MSATTRTSCLPAAAAAATVAIPALPESSTQAPHPPPVSRQVAQQAAQWFVRCSEGKLTPQAQQAFDTWLAADPAHTAAWERAMHISGHMQQLPANVASPVLQRPSRHSTNRRAAIRALAALLVTAPAGWWAWRHAPAPWHSDWASATGQLRTVTLPDGTQVLLDTASAIDVAFDATQRAIHLRAGAIMVTTAPDPIVRNAPHGLARPFLVLTEQGQARAIGTQFSIRLEGNRSQVAVLEGAVALSPRNGHATHTLHAGQQSQFTSNAVSDVEPLSTQAQQWANGILAVENMPLGSFVAELARYRSGLLQCDPAIASLRITGAFRVADTDAVLHNLTQLLPISVRQRTRYWVTLVPQTRDSE
ncbi:DUF4880 domain-containing protein [Lampropedia puyangensis]|uniref:DUF4880 domain-containing protein n=1 Tax=Lampropedia puyangensis TaxID=1330072 RepID=A0A4S8FCP7_9BURK|nr:FecR domain-containing protein [Lampropedia puyangensis]THU05089.1 DUF4880 domain-containing protein [Lampropedia puyangensis]